VGIHGSTLSRWIKEGVVTPEYGPHYKQFFTMQQVHFCRAVKSMLDRYRGHYSLPQVIQIVRGERELVEGHSPPGAPRPVWPATEPGADV
jgi:hypothetical protein